MMGTPSPPLNVDSRVGMEAINSRNISFKDCEDKSIQRDYLKLVGQITELRSLSRDIEARALGGVSKVLFAVDTTEFYAYSSPLSNASRSLLFSSSKSKAAVMAEHLFRLNRMLRGGGATILLPTTAEEVGRYVENLIRTHQAQSASISQAIAKYAHDSQHDGQALQGFPDTLQKRIEDIIREASSKAIEGEKGWGDFQAQALQILRKGSEGMKTLTSAVILTHAWRGMEHETKLRRLRDILENGNIKQLNRVVWGDFLPSGGGEVAKYIHDITVNKSINADYRVAGLAEGMFFLINNYSQGGDGIGQKSDRNISSDAWSCAYLYRLNSLLSSYGVEVHMVSTAPQLLAVGDALHQSGLPVFIRHPEFLAGDLPEYLIHELKAPVQKLHATLVGLMGPLEDDIRSRVPFAQIRVRLDGIRDRTAESWMALKGVVYSSEGLASANQMQDAFNRDMLTHKFEGGNDLAKTIESVVKLSSKPEIEETFRRTTERILGGYSEILSLSYVLKGVGDKSADDSAGTVYRGQGAYRGQGDDPHVVLAPCTERFRYAVKFFDKDLVNELDVFAGDKLTFHKLSETAKKIGANKDHLHNSFMLAIMAGSLGNWVLSHVHLQKIIEDISGCFLSGESGDLEAVSAKAAAALRNGLSATDTEVANAWLLRESLYLRHLVLRGLAWKNLLRERVAAQQMADAWQNLQCAVKIKGSDIRFKLAEIGMRIELMVEPRLASDISSEILEKYSVRDLVELCFVEQSKIGDACQSGTFFHYMLGRVLQMAMTILMLVWLDLMEGYHTPEDKCWILGQDWKKILEQFRGIRPDDEHYRAGSLIEKFGEFLTKEPKNNHPDDLSKVYRDLQSDGELLSEMQSIRLHFSRGGFIDAISRKVIDRVSEILEKDAVGQVRWYFSHLRSGTPQTLEEWEARESRLDSLAENGGT